MSPERYEIVRRDGDSFLSGEPRDGAHPAMAFLGPGADGRARFRYLSRARPRVAD